MLLQYGRPLYGDVFGVQQPEPMFYEVWNRAFILGNSGFKDAVEGQACMSSIWFLQATQFWLCVPALCIALVRAQFSV